MADTGHGTQADDHLLIYIEHRQHEQQRPEQRIAVILPGLAIGAERACIVVAGHDDEAGPDNGEQRHESCPPALARRGVVLGNGAECATYLTEMHLIEDSCRR
jgi:hypothetical protein